LFEYLVKELMGDTVVTTFEQLLELTNFVSDLGE